MEILLKKVRSYEDIKREVMIFVKDNIVEIEKTSVWKNIIHMCELEKKKNSMEEDDGEEEDDEEEQLDEKKNKNECGCEAEEIESGEGSEDFMRAEDTSDYVEIMNELVQFLQEQNIQLSHDKDPEDVIVDVPVVII